MKKNILFSVCSLGMGHASRTLPIIKKLSTSYNIYIASTGHALAFLKGELTGEPVRYFDTEGYPPLERGKGIFFYLYLINDLIRSVILIKKENKLIEKIVRENRISLIIADGNYGSFSKTIPCFFIAHQVRLIINDRIKFYQPMVDVFNIFIFKNFNCVLIPDYPDKNVNLAGELSHNRIINKICHKYIGLLSSCITIDLPKDIDWLFIVSGFLEDQKHSFIDDMIEQGKKLPGKKVFVLGDTTHNYHKVDIENNTEVYSYTLGRLRLELLNRAKFIISRSGYSTIMDLAEMGKDAMLIPTRNQAEQEYLAKYLGRCGYFLTAKSEKNLDLPEQLTVERKIKKFQPAWKVEASVNMIKDEVKNYMHEHFFSIIIPAHNEEKVIAETIEYLQALNYDKSRYEVIVVENGSADKTYEIANSMAGENVKAFSVNVKGVSGARNFGIKQVAAESEWFVLLDADTALKADFLQHLNNYLNKNKNKNLVVGTTYMSPDKPSAKANNWFRFYNLGHKLTKSSFALQIMKRSISDLVQYDENLRLGEDLKMINDARKIGQFFCFKTDEAVTSIRRFEEEGWFRLFLKWNFEALLPFSIKKKLNYRVIR